MTHSTLTARASAPARAPLRLALPLPPAVAQYPSFASLAQAELGLNGDPRQMARRALAVVLPRLRDDWSIPAWSISEPVSPWITDFAAVLCAVREELLTSADLDAARLGPVLHERERARDEDLRPTAGAVFAAALYLATPTPPDIALRIAGDAAGVEDFAPALMDHPAATTDHILNAIDELLTYRRERSFEMVAACARHPRWGQDRRVVLELGNAEQRFGVPAAVVTAALLTDGPLDQFDTRLDRLLTARPRTDDLLAEALQRIAAQGATGDRSRVARIGMADIRPLLGAPSNALRLAATQMLAYIDVATPPPAIDILDTEEPASWDLTSNAPLSAPRTRPGSR